MNQQVARKLLEHFGHEVTLANNGLEVLRSYESGRFDLVFMDVQMPEMNGFDATARLRDLQESRGERTPIIAMTAHAMTGDCERCLEAGMDDYISKPIDAQRLKEMVEKHAPIEGPAIPVPRTAANLPEHAGDEESQARQAEMRHVIDEKAARERFADCPLVFDELLTLFASQCLQLQAEVAAAAERADMPALGRAVHTLKGSADAIAARGVVMAARHVELLLRKHDLTHIANSVQALQHECDCVMNFLKCRNETAAAST